MGFVECCGRNQLAKSYKIKPQEGYLAVVLNILSKCQFCDAPTIELKRLDLNNNISTVKKRKRAAMLFYEKIKSNIISEINLRGKHEFR